MPSLPSPAVLAAHADRRSNEALCRHLEAFGWKVFSAYDGAAALTILRCESVRLAILDLDLPVLDGVEVVLAARATGRSFHVVFLDTSERPESERKCLDLGALAYIVKPLSPECLERLLQDALRRSPPPGREGSRNTTDSLAELSPGVRVRLCIQAGPSTGTYPAEVVDKTPASLVISAQAFDGSPVYVSLGTSMLVGFPASQGWGEFESRVAGSYVGSAGTEILLSFPDQVVYRERRGPARLKATLPIRVWPVEAEDRASSMISGQTEDIGRRGLRALFRGPLSSDEPVVLAISAKLGVEGPRLLGRAVWHEALGEPGQAWHRYGFRFLSLAPEARRSLGALLAHIRSRGDDLATTGEPETCPPGTPESPPTEAGEFS